MGVVRQLQRTSVGRVFVDVFDWYPAHLPTRERKLLRKLDCSILIFACLQFFVKFLDQSNITNAYVSGLEEDIGAYGNDLNYFNVAYYTAYVVGQIPMMSLQTKPWLAPYFLPTLEIFWGILTFCQSRVTRPWHVYLLRALIGFFEAPSFGGTHLILGSWYRQEELFKRAGVWFMGNSLGSMFSGYLQAAAYKNLNGVGGLAGWRWLFIVDGIITIPLALIGFALFPGLPNSPKKWFFSDDEYALATDRLKDGEGRHGQDEGITWKTFKTTLSRPMWWICVPAYICMINSSYWVSYMSLWLKAEKYPTTLVNIYPTFVNLVQALSSWLGTTLAVTIGVKYLWSFQYVVTTFAMICLSVWDIPKGLKFASFYLGGVTGMASPILYSWINSTLRTSTAERGLIISSMMTAGYCTYIWVPLFTFPTVEAPRFPHGYPPSVVFNFALWAIIMFGIWFMARRRKLAAARGEGELSGTSTPVSETSSREKLGGGEGEGGAEKEGFSEGEVGAGVSAAEAVVRGRVAV